MKNLKTKITTILIVFTSFVGFYYLSDLNYNKIHSLKYNLVKHPEFLPTKNFSKNTSFGFSNLKADTFWLQAIQYIGANALGSEYKKYLYVILDLITDLNPYFEKPYIIGQLLLPGYNERYEKLTAQEQNDYTKQAELLGLKGIKNFCNINKVEKIKSYTDLQKLWSDESLKNPCKKNEIAFNQGFLYYYYLKDSKESSDYYKVASMIDGALGGAKIMAATMSGKAGDNMKSFLMFLTLADQNNKSGECSELISYLGTFYSYYQNTGIIPSKELKAVDLYRKEINKNKEESVYGETCFGYLNKAVRQLNLEYLNNASKKYILDNNKPINTISELLDNKYIDYNPVDYQQYDTYGIKYYYNNETKTIDYKMENN